MRGALRLRRAGGCCGAGAVRVRRAGGGLWRGWVSRAAGWTVCCAGALRLRRTGGCCGAGAVRVRRAGRCRGAGCVAPAAGWGVLWRGWVSRAAGWAVCCAGALRLRRTGGCCGAGGFRVRRAGRCRGAGCVAPAAGWGVLWCRCAAPAAGWAVLWRGWVSRAAGWAVPWRGCGSRAAGRAVALARVRFACGGPGRCPGAGALRLRRAGPLPWRGCVTPAAGRAVAWWVALFACRRLRGGVAAWLCACGGPFACVVGCTPCPRRAARPPHTDTLRPRRAPRWVALFACGGLRGRVAAWLGACGGPFGGSVAWVSPAVVGGWRPRRAVSVLGPAGCGVSRDRVLAGRCGRTPPGASPSRRARVRHVGPVVRPDGWPPSRSARGGSPCRRVRGSLDRPTGSSSSRGLHSPG
ncbi:hypothetical protein FB157_101526 [Streptomyces sp. BK340]|nr:hypothetical protein FB157_101526 [Streptomyces sp. BK340]